LPSVSSRCHYRRGQPRSRSTWRRTRCWWRGSLEIEDVLTFKTKVAPLKDAARVSLISTGGRINTDIQIGHVIRQRGWHTVVPPGATCTSACAIAWLAGTTRSMWPTSKVGFHAAYKMREGQPHEPHVCPATHSSGPI
jgi:hypothetical protein